MAELQQAPGKTGGRRRAKKALPRVDLTAMVDLAFLLITFFMLTTSLTKPREMELNMPVGDHPEPVSENTTVSVCLGAKNKAVYYLGMPEKPLTIPQTVGYGKDMRNALLDMGKQIYAKTGKSMMLVIKPAEHSIYDNLIDVLDEANITKVQSYAVGNITKSDIDILKAKGLY